MAGRQERRQDRHHRRRTPPTRRRRRAAAGSRPGRPRRRCRPAPTPRRPTWSEVGATSASRRLSRTTRRPVVTASDRAGGDRPGRQARGQDPPPQEHDQHERESRSGSTTYSGGSRRFPGWLAGRPRMRPLSQQVAPATACAAPMRSRRTTMTDPRAHVRLRHHRRPPAACSLDTGIPHLVPASMAIGDKSARRWGRTEAARRQGLPVPLPGDGRRDAGRDDGRRRGGPRRPGARGWDSRPATGATALEMAFDIRRWSPGLRYRSRLGKHAGDGRRHVRPGRGAVLAAGLGSSTARPCSSWSTWRCSRSCSWSCSAAATSMRRTPWLAPRQPAGPGPTG